MKITDEMIDAAVRGYWSDLYNIDAMRENRIIIQLP